MVSAKPAIMAILLSQMKIVAKLVTANVRKAIQRCVGAQHVLMTNNGSNPI
jgi:hypothetical protein